MRKVQFVNNQIYHIFNRGVEKRDIFLDDSDRWRFLQGMFLFNDEETSSHLLWRLEREKRALNFTVLKEFMFKERTDRKPLVRFMADCLMPNHYHFIIEQLREGGVSRLMHKFGIGYTKYFNERHKRVGSLHQGPFKAVLEKDETQLKYLLVYLNVINPGMLIEPRLKEEGVKDADAIMKFAEEYPWSTHQEYLGKRSSIIIDKGILGEIFADPEEYREFARETLLGRKFDATILC